MSSSELVVLHRGLRSASMGALLNVVIGLASAMVLSRLFEPRVLGAFTLATTSVGFIVQLSTLSEQAALIRALARTERGSPEAKALFLAVFTLSFILTALVSVLVVLASSWYFISIVSRSELIAPMVVLVIVYAIFDNASWNIESALSAYGGAGTLAVVRIVQALVLFGGTVAIGWTHRTAWALTIGAIIASVVGCIIRVVIVRRLFACRIDRHQYVEGLRQLPEIIRFGLKVLPGSMAQGLVGQLPTWVLGATSSLTTVGLFGRAQGIAARVGDVNYRIGAVVFPSFVRQGADDEADRESGHSVAGRSHLADGVVSVFNRSFIPLAVGIAAVAGASRSALTVLGPDYVPGESILVALLAAVTVHLAEIITGEALTAAGHPTKTSRAGLLSLVVCLAAMVPLTRSFGGVGAASALLLAGSTSTAARLWFLRSALRHTWVTAGARRTATIALLGSGMAFAATHALQAIGGVPVVIATGVVVAIGGAAAWMFIRARRGRTAELALES